MTPLYVIAIILLLIPVKLIFPIRRLGFKKVPPPKEKLIIVCNHLSIRDIFVIGSIFPGRQVRFLSKRELVQNNKFVATIFRWLGVISVSRGEFDFTAIKTVVNMLNRNKTVGIFPEGTRNRTEEDMLELKNGVALFSLKSGAKIVPLYQSRKQPFFRRNWVYMGEAFDFSDIPGDKINKEKLALATEKLTERMNDARDKLHAYLEEHHIKIKPSKVKKSGKSRGESGE